MTMQMIASAVQRVKAILQRRPDTGLHDDAAAVSRWEFGTRVVSRHANGVQIATDMPHALGGSGDQVTPGWLLRAGLSSCLATCIALDAAARGIELDALEVAASSRSDLRGLLGLTDASGEPVGPGPCDMQLRVRISAVGVSSERLRNVVHASHRCSPVAAALGKAVPIALSIDVLVI